MPNAQAQPDVILPPPRFPLDHCVVEESRVFNIAAAQCPMDFLEFLEIEGADVRHIGAYGYTALHAAITARTEADPKSVVDWILARGISINAYDEFGRTALHIAAMRGMRQICEVLIKRGAAANALDPEGLRPADYVPTYGFDDLRRELETAALAQALGPSSNVRGCRARL